MIERGVDVERNEGESNMYCDGLFVYNGSHSQQRRRPGKREKEREREARMGKRDGWDLSVCVCVSVRGAAAVWLLRGQRLVLVYGFKSDS